MYSKDIDTTRSSRPWYSIQDARMKNIANASRYSDRQKLEAERVKLALDTVYHNSNIYINYRERFIAVKVDRAQPRTGFKLERATLEKEYEQRGYQRRVSAQGIIYRIPRA